MNKVERCENLPALQGRIAASARQSYVIGVKGALITVKCDCSKINYLAYGDVWDCTCGRRWNTSQIPAAEYWGIMHEMRRERLVVVGVALALCLTFGLLAFLVAQRLLLFFPVIMAGWYILYMPRWRRRMRQRVRNLPNWQLRPE
jgi:hypothetical protein